MCVIEECCYISPKGYGCKKAAVWQIVPEDTVYSDTYSCAMHIRHMLSYPVEYDGPYNSFIVTYMGS